jgi:type II secretory ATPase GspE/PulE/Tfp pilus assembly ATPase PilB-like protein
VTADAEECALMGMNPEHPPTIYRAVGCDKCNFSGYRGRVGIYELMVVDDTMRRLIHSHAGEHELEAHARTMQSQYPGLMACARHWPASPRSKRCCALPVQTDGRF